MTLTALRSEIGVGAALPSVPPRAPSGDDRDPEKEFPGRRTIVPETRRLALGIGLTGLYVLAARLGLSFAFLHASATPVWPPTGIALATLLILGPSMWPVVFVGAFAANLITAGSVATSLGIALGNTLEALIGAALVTRFAGGPAAFDRAADIFRFVGLVALSAAASATMGVTCLGLAGEAHWSEYAGIWTTWWLGNVAGAVIVTPVVLLWTRPAARAVGRGLAVEAAGIVIAAVAIAGTVFWDLLPGTPYPPIAFVCIPPLLWAAFRFGQREAAILIAVLSGIAVGGTVQGTGPFALATANASLLLLQAFMATMALTMLPVGAMVAEWRRTSEQVRTALTAARESEARLHGMIYAAMDAIVSVDEQQRIEVFNAAAERMFRCRAADVLGLPLDRLIPPRVRGAHRRHVEEFGRRGATARRMGALGELTALRADGEEFPIEASIAQAEAGGRKVFTVILRDITERKRSEAALRQALADKDVLLREVHHRVKNNFQMLCDLLYLQAATVEGHQVQHVLQDTYGRMFALARVHEELHQSLAGGEIRLAEYLGRLVRGLQAVHPEVRIVLHVPPEDIVLDVDRAIYTGLIANELLTNAVKYGCRDGKPGEITAWLCTRDAQVELRIKDSGPGLPEHLDLSKAKSLGLRIVQILGRRLKASVQVENGGGACYTIQFPLKAPD